MNRVKMSCSLSLFWRKVAGAWIRAVIQNLRDFADAVTWRKSFLASPGLLSLWIPVTVPLRPGQRRPTRAPPYDHQS